MNFSDFDIAVIGGGPSGLMAAGTAAKSGARVVLFEKMQSCGFKLLMTGSGACNITNADFSDKASFLENFFENGKFLYPALSAFSQDALLKFFNENGIEFVVREDNKVFPSNGSAKTILDALLNFCLDGNVTIKTGAEITHVNKHVPASTGKFILSEKESHWFADKIIITTGGLSYPVTGSTGDGYVFGKQFSHSIVTPRPALVGLTISNITDFGYLSGVSLRNVKVSLIEKQISGQVTEQSKILKSYTGDLLFTHVGVSGPAALYLSRFLPHDLNKGKSISTGNSYFLSINNLEGKNVVETDALLVNFIDKNPKKNISNIISSEFEIPASFVKFMLAKIGLEPDIDACKITKANRKKISSALHSTELEIFATQGFSKAMVTAGGVSIKEINPKTMESKLESGLYFAGEVIDIDGFTGGFNLQAAFSTGYLAGLSAAGGSTEGSVLLV